MKGNSRGDTETIKLRQNIEDQLQRLLTQLQDLEDMKDELDEDEYTSSRQDTIEQLKEFELSLKKMVSGNISLVDSIGAVQLAIQSAIKSVHSSEISIMFTKKQNNALRIQLASLDSDLKLGRINLPLYTSQTIEILKMLEKLGEILPTKEKEFLLKNATSMDSFSDVAKDFDIGEDILKTASEQIINAEKNI